MSLVRCVIAQNKAQEKFAVGTRLVEIAMKMLEHAIVFRELKNDSDNDKITTEALAGAFKQVHAPLSDDEAETLAALILARSNDDDGSNRKDLLEMDYVEYVNSIEATMLDFEDFKRLGLEFAAKRGYKQKIDQLKRKSSTVFPLPLPDPNEPE
jgi:hypothetical protein